ncbi:hypothetical protein IFM89_029532 [Coptis chinensis]|uniref:Uncharacterized protein n=1 Tax=Coptis chinensis TaxID=261450 RepID=A0A835LJS9_9MAGN|nr:hypothetical protein IFM89_029532 [Coptis chinensis]
MAGYVPSKKTMEINAENSIMEELRKRADADMNDQCVRELVLLLFQTYLLTSGFSLDEPNAFINRIHRMLTLVLSLASSNTEEGLKLDEREDEKKKKAELKEKFEGLCTLIKDVVGDKVGNMIVSDRVLDSPYSLVTDAYGPTADKERGTKALKLRDSSMPGYVPSKKTMEINTENSIMEELRKRAETDKIDSSFNDLVMLLFETALLTSGFSIDEPNALGNCIYRMLKFVLSIDDDNADTETASDSDMPPLEDV